MYTPPFTISARAIQLVAEISAQVERYAIRLEAEDGLRLRKANRIKTIHSSLAIEGNKLTEGQVTDILDGKTVIAPVREIQEVKNAIAAYNLYPTLNPYAVKDLLRTHGVMMQGILENPGHFRSGNVGVFEGERCIHLAPPPQNVPTLINELFEWVRKAPDHILIRSCVFHYEFEFIHPFMDGNGRMGRMWQSLLLREMSPVFEHLPIENMVYANQSTYYDAIAASTRQNDCSPMIDFLLQEIYDALLSHQQTEDVGVNVGVNVGVKEQEVLNLLVLNPSLSAAKIGDALHISTRQAERLLAALKQKNRIRRVGADRNGHWEIIE